MFHGGVKILLEGGDYHFVHPVILGKEFKGSKSSPIIISTKEGEEVTLMVAKKFRIKIFKSYRKTEQAKLAQNSINTIYATISDPDLIKAFSDRLMLNLTINDKEYLPSRFPNEGYADFVEETVISEYLPLLYL